MPARFEFDWDPAKAAANLVKHNVSFEDALLVFADPLALSRLDDPTEANEERWITIGFSHDFKAAIGRTYIHRACSGHG